MTSASAETESSDENNNTPKVSAVKSAKKVAGDNSLVATSSNAIQLYQPPANLPPVGTVLPSLVGKKNSNKPKRIAKNKNAELSEIPELEESKIRKSERLKKANSVTPMGGVKYV